MVDIKIDTAMGTPGLSAYEIALNFGYDGTEQEWILSLKQPSIDAGNLVGETNNSIIEREKIREKAERGRIDAENKRRVDSDKAIKSTNIATDRANESVELVNQTIATLDVIDGGEISTI